MVLASGPVMALTSEPVTAAGWALEVGTAMAQESGLALDLRLESAMALPSELTMAVDWVLESGSVMAVVSGLVTAAESALKSVTAMAQEAGLI